MQKLIEALERYVGGDLDVGGLHKKLYTLSKRMDMDELDPLVAGLLEDMMSEVDALAREVSWRDANDDGTLRYAVAARLSELKSSLDLE